MPNRIVREGIIDSGRMEALVRDAGWPAEVFYRRLHSVVDDFGCYDARYSVLRARCFPTLLDLVREADVSRWIAACVKSGLVRLYQHEGREYLEVIDFKQFTRAKRRKFPIPPEHAMQMQCTRTASALGDGDGDGDGNPPNPPRGGRVGKSRAAPIGTDAFRRFYDAYPKLRKSGRPVVWKKWRTLECEPIADEIMAGLQRWKRSVEWQREAGRFIPAPEVWLNKQRWVAYPEACELAPNDPTEDEGIALMREVAGGDA